MAGGFQSMKAEWKRKRKHGIGREKERGNGTRERHEKEKGGRIFPSQPAGKRATRTSV